MTLINIILLVGIAQGIFLTVLLFHKHSELFANRLLGSLVVLYTLSLLHVLLGNVGFYLATPKLMFVLLSMIFLIGPMHFLYARFLMQPRMKFRAKEWLHFVPVLLYLLFVSPELIRPSDDIKVVEQDFNSIEVPWMFKVVNWFFVLQMLGYMTMTLIHLRRYVGRLKTEFSNIEKIKLGWLKNITYMASLATLTFAVENIMIEKGWYGGDFMFSSILSGIYIYAMGYMGLTKSEVFSREVAKTKAEQPVSQASKKYEKSGLSQKKADEYLSQLIRLMEEEEVFTDNTLTLQDLSERLSISIHHLSETINSKLQQNFFDFINQYRVNKVIRDLSDPGKDHLTILAIALEAGFNSKSSFNTIFKNQTGLTPSQYKKKTGEEVSV